MALTSAVTKPVEVPHEPGNTFTIRMLSWLHIKEARERRTSAALQAARELGPELLKDIQSAAAPSAEPVRARDPLDDFDQATVLRHGVVGWSGPGYQTPCTPDALAELDPTTAEWAAREVCHFSLGLRTEEERLNDSSPST